MNSYDFSQVDFSNEEVQRSLARAYAVVLRIPAPPKEETDGVDAKEEEEQDTHHRAADVAVAPMTEYVQARMF